MKTPFDFSQKTVLVTGASMGIGEVFARELARRGAKVVLIARSRDRLEKLARELPGAEFLVEDLAAPGAARRVFEAVSARGLLPDLLVNNAGFGTHGRFDELALDIQREAIDLNVGALVELTHLCLPALEQRQGGVINIASTAGLRPRPGLTWYNGSKGAVIVTSKSMAAELGPENIRVNCINPVFNPDTGLAAEFAGGPVDEERRARFRATIPLGRFSTALDVANAALYLASDEAAFISGTCIEVDGARCV